MAADRDAVLGVIQRHADELRALGVRRLALFGSAARGEATADSDLDFVVDLDPKTFDAYMDTKLLLEKLLGHRVDLVLADAIKPRLRPFILREAVYAAGF
jgi:hypothetical protein